MNRRPLFLIALALVFFVGLPAAQADDAKKEELTRKLLQLTGSADLGKQMMEGMAGQFRQTPGVTEEFIDTFLELAKPEDLIDLIVPLYVKAFDVQTLEAAIVFYESPAGRKLVEMQPQLTQESMVLGQQWGMELAQETQRVMEERRKK